MHDDSISAESLKMNTNVKQTRNSVYIANDVERGIEIDVICNQPEIRKVRDCTDAIKSTCVQVSVQCGISAEIAILAVKIVCQALYNHTYYLNKE